MKCCGSPTTFTGLDRPPRLDATARELAGRFEGLLLQSAFAPLAHAIGFYGDTVVAAATQAMLRGNGEGLAAPLARAIESASPEGAGW
jgi:hypothetical protein